jgi:hypothetical protein
MSMRPIIIAGCGGSGGKVVQLLRQELELRLLRAGWTTGIPKAWQLLYLDTPATQESAIPGIAALPLTDYVSVSGGFDNYEDVATSLFNTYSGHEDKLVGWLPEKEIAIPLTDGAGQMRAVGRATAFSSLDKVGKRLNEAYEHSISNSAELSQLYRLLNPGKESKSLSNDQLPYIFVISSLAGGTGAGIFMDVCDVFRAVEKDLSNRISGVLFSAEVFSNLKQEPGLQPNSLAAISEIMAGSFDLHRPMESLYTKKLSMAAEFNGPSGPAYPYIVGTSTMAGAGLSEIIDSYRATTQTLAAVMLNPDQIGLKFTQYQTTNWATKQSGNFVPWAFGNQDPISETKGVFSSFGSSTLSVGLRRFEEYSVLRAARSVIDFQNAGWQALGHDVMGQPAASSEEIIEFLKNRHGPEFVSNCQLSEAETDGQVDRNNQIIDQLCTKNDLDNKWQNWRNEVFTELQHIGSASTSHWQQYIASTITNKSERFATDVKSLVASGREHLVGETPTRLLAETTRMIAKHGLPVAKGLLSYTRDDLDIAKAQLKSEASNYRQGAQRWKSDLAAAFLEAPKNLPADHQLIKNGIKAAASKQYYEALAEIRERGAELISELQDQVIDPFVAILLQIQAGLGTVTTTDQWPGSYGVPTHLAPPPLEFCILPHGEWPDLFVEKASTSAEHDTETGSWESVLRTMIGAGGFTKVLNGREEQAQSAIELAKGSNWAPRCAGGDGLSIKFEHHYDINDVVNRSREWITREGTAMGSFLNQGLKEYLDDTYADGTAIIDHSQRLQRFQQCFQKVLQSASPLIGIANAAALKVHPKNHQTATGYEYTMEPLPISPGHPAYDIAREVIQITAPDENPDEFFGTERNGIESATCSTLLNSAVHPACITSLLGPVAAAWNSSYGASSFWMRRRARTFKEFIPVHPWVLKSMIRGWITGRMLGLIQAPTEESGFAITSWLSDEESRFPWPLVRGHIDTGKASAVSWLPWLLESLPLGFARYATEPTILDGYDELYLLGQTNRTSATKGSPSDDYPEMSYEITQFIENGVPEGSNSPALSLSLDSDLEALTPHEKRRSQLMQYLTKFQETLQKQLANDISGEHIWEVKSGYDLFEDIIKEAQTLKLAIGKAQLDEDDVA